MSLEAEMKYRCVHILASTWQSYHLPQTVLDKSNALFTLSRVVSWVNTLQVVDYAMYSVHTMYSKWWFNGNVYTPSGDLMGFTQINCTGRGKNVSAK